MTGFRAIQSRQTNPIYPWFPDISGENEPIYTTFRDTSDASCDRCAAVCDGSNLVCDNPSGKLRSRGMDTHPTQSRTRWIWGRYIAVSDVIRGFYAVVVRAGGFGLALRTRASVFERSKSIRLDAEVGEHDGLS